MKKTLRVVAIGAALFVGSAAPALAAPPSGSIPLHQHYITNPHGTIAVAQQFCGGEQSVAFDNFHTNVHVAAPGLDSSPAVSITATGCP